MRCLRRPVPRGAAPFPSHRRSTMAEANTKHEIETLQSDFSQLRADLQTLTKTIGDISRRRAEEGVVSLKDVGTRTAERVRAAAASANSMKDAGLAAAERQVV